MADFKRETCGRGPETGHTVYRVNAKGQPGIWRCEYHRNNINVPADVDELVSIIERGNKDNNS